MRVVVQSQSTKSMKYWVNPRMSYHMIDLVLRQVSTTINTKFGEILKIISALRWTR